MPRDQLSSHHSSVEQFRSHTIDVVRGTALLGILLVNIQSHLAMPRTHVETLAATFVDVLVANKFYPIFSLLFGIGVAIQLEHRIGNARTRCASRLAALYCIGLALYILVDANHILLTYAVVGALLILGQPLSNRCILYSVALISMAAITYPIAVRSLEVAGSLSEPSGIMSDESAHNRETVRRERQGADLRRSYLEWVRVRARAYWSRWTAAGPTTMYHIAAICFAGMYIVRRQVIHDGWLFARQLLLRRMAVWLIVTGCGGLLLSRFWIPEQRDMMDGIVDRGVLFVSGTMLSLGYATAIAYVANARRAAALPRFVAAAGQMALTHFICQSVVLSVIFHGYGFGLEGEVGPAAGCILAVVIWSTQLVVGVWWLKYFNCGPAEWAWRTLAYGGTMPLRRQSSRHTVRHALA